MPPAPAHPLVQLFWLLVLAIPVATVAHTFVFEEVFRELHDYCKRKSESCRTLIQRKFFYLFTCEYCFSHWVAVFFIALTNFRLLIDDWHGYLIAWFALVFIANIYLNLYARLRMDITSEKKLIQKLETEIKQNGGDNQETEGRVE